MSRCEFTLLLPQLSTIYFSIDTVRKIGKSISRCEFTELLLLPQLSNIIDRFKVTLLMLIILHKYIVSSPYSIIIFIIKYTVS